MNDGTDLNAEFRIVGLPAFRDNYIWLLAADQEAIVVDPGDASPVLDYLGSHGLKLKSIWLTHHHADHVGGVATLLERCPQTPVFGPAAESITGVSTGLSGGESIDAFGRRWEVFSLPGHTCGHLGYYTSGTLFCGDVLFGLGCGRLFEGTPAEMHTALAKIAALPSTTAIYCAHEYTELNLPFALMVEPDNQVLQARAVEIGRRRDVGQSTVPLSLAEELATNPFLRAQVVSVAAAARGYDGTVDVADPLSVFAALRDWRNRV